MMQYAAIIFAFLGLLPLLMGLLMLTADDSDARGLGFIPMVYVALPLFVVAVICEVIHFL